MNAIKDVFLKYQAILECAKLLANKQLEITGCSNKTMIQSICQSKKKTTTTLVQIQVHKHSCAYLQK